MEDPDHSATDVFFKYRVSAFEIKGKGEAESVVLSGSKKLTNHREIHFQTPELLLDETEYKFRHNLRETIDLLKMEVLAYMEGKQAPNTQLEMFSDTEDLDVVEETQDAI